MIFCEKFILHYFRRANNKERILKITKFIKICVREKIYTRFIKKLLRAKL